MDKKKSEKIWLIRCNNCGIVRESYMRFFSRCKGCSIISKTKSYSQFLNDAKKKHGEKYIYNENDYVNTSSKIKILCTQCGNYFDQLVRDHLEGHGCSYCNEPKGEIAIRLYLDKINVKYERNKSFSGLVYKSSLKYDFYLTDLNLLIEFDGKQHFEIVNFSRNHKSNLKRFEDSKLRDGIKDDWSKNNNIPLLRIPYWDMNRIPELIDEFLNSHIKKKVNQLCFDFDI